jgi:radical SAM superfamily enzyme
MQESPGSNKETIETHSLLSQTSVKPLKSHAQHIQKQMHTRKTYIQEHMSIIHRETTPSMKLNHRLFY